MGNGYHLGSGLANEALLILEPKTMNEKPDVPWGSLEKNTVKG